MKMMIKKLALPSNDWRSVLKGGALAVAGALVTFGLAHVGDLNFGTYGPLIVPIVTVILDVLQKALKNPSQPNT